ncbi:MAG: hypothetical protein QXZ44_01300 [Ferroplasma sp.]
MNIFNSSAVFHILWLHCSFRHNREKNPVLKIFFRKEYIYTDEIKNIFKFKSVETVPQKATWLNDIWNSI